MDLSLLILLPGSSILSRWVLVYGTEAFPLYTTVHFYPHSLYVLRTRAVRAKENQGERKDRRWPTHSFNMRKYICLAYCCMINMSRVATTVAFRGAATRQSMLLLLALLLPSSSAFQSMTAVRQQQQQLLRTINSHWPSSNRFFAKTVGQMRTHAAAAQSAPLFLSSSGAAGEELQGIDLSLDPRLYKVRLSRASGVE